MRAFDLVDVGLALAVLSFAVAFAWLMTWLTGSPYVVPPVCT